MKIGKHSVSANGLLPNHYEPDGVAKNEPNEKEIALATKWIETFAQHRKTINRREFSYGLKHSVETWTWETTDNREYVSNGAFIVAALRAGYDLHARGINAFFDMSVVRWKKRAKR